MSRFPRYHALDSLRSVMMLLGIVLHGAIPYMATNDLAWPFKDPNTSRSFDLLVVLIHIFRMPVFFVMAGFFASFLYLERGESYFIRNRTKRIFLPFALFWPFLVVLTIAAFWYGQGEAGQRTAASVTAFGLNLLHRDTWIHLWFLYDLLFLYLVVLVSARIPFPASFTERIDHGFRRFLSSSFKAVWLAPVLILTLIPMRSGMLDTGMPWIPLAPYWVFFAIGWLLYRSRDLLHTFKKGAWFQLALGLLFFPLAIGVIVRLRSGAFSSERGIHIAAAAASGLVMTFLVLATVGLFLRYLDGYNRFVRYFTDASYWIYLLHLPVTIWISAVLIRFDAPPFAKFMLVQVGTVAVTVFSYHYFVRATFVGEMLTGRRWLTTAKPQPNEMPS